ncbi:MAG: hypothetical protein COW73_02645 [Nitrospirae bacterium CG18_big_fil_WC_8_21_14_2_50_70_55]|nr:MAG: hypothetical protein AUK30_07200 [Nitrospirae bacterium CG2_30_70_394]PIQ06695.1 MAG: hypothetical protein COW73_02645 [Nitrospirae bacterium CG18_big_fil_WC_8_21_14_2_50_70_55]PIU77974.1 MAG: hypothetical protein COS73_08545 [Nitrospirae bacterium CG06_land_8_20_14_3_00_70_43]PIW83420.1 MAG: hypothetical protein COZ96_03460 [Nitrospirae bacterium CG_4_8_14_3_um_filter_70_85]PIX82709.1 MAG: hypothetical protein COZ33_09230 [Nitrospirae bacterium CG_4_10_14_3_um_filter_70_108]PJB95294.1
MAPREGRSPAEREEAFRRFRDGDLEGARQLCAKLCRADPGDAEVWLLYGLCHRGLGHGEEATRCLQRAVEANPIDPDCRAALGRVLIDQQRAGAAAAAFREGIRLLSTHEDSHLGLAAALLMAGRYREAVAATEAAEAAGVASGELFAQRATACERLHRLAAARAAAERALTLDPGQPRAAFTLAQVEARLGEVAAARARLEGLVATRLPPFRRAAVTAELGKLLDRAGEYEAAFAAFTAANRAMASTFDPRRVDVDAIFKQIDQSRAWFTAERVAGWRGDEPADDTPSPVFLVGFPRSGTTLTEQLLASVGGVVVSDEQAILDRLLADAPGLLKRRQVPYPDWLADLTPTDLAWLRLHYWKLAEEMVAPVAEGVTFVDKLPLNLLQLGAVHRLFPRAKVVFVVRDPRDCCLSCYMRAFVPNQAMVNFLDLERTARFYGAAMELGAHYRAVLPLDGVEVRYEALVADLEGGARRLLDFLGLPWDEAVLRFHERAGERDVTTPSYAAVASPIDRTAVGRWRHYQQQLAPILPTLAPYVEAFGYPAG